MSIAEGDQLANERSQDYRLRFAVALTRTADRNTTLFASGFATPTGIVALGLSPP